MIETRQMPHIEPLPFDHLLVAFLKRRPQSLNPHPPKDIAVLNLKGELYRIIRMGAHSDFRALLIAFAPHGLFDRVKPGPAAAGEIDAITGLPYRGPYAAVLQVGVEAHPLPD